MNKDPSFVPENNDVNWEQVQDDDTMLHVLINLQDINDNAPVFEQLEYIAGMFSCFSRASLIVEIVTKVRLSLHIRIAE